MKYSEAETATKGCEHSIPIAEESLSQQYPDPNQEAIILCRAKVIPEIIQEYGSLIEGKKFIQIGYSPRMTECEMSPCPSSDNCKVAEAAKRINGFPVHLEVDANDYKNGKVNLDPLKGKVVFENH